ncbi:hypothetical protein UQW22_15060 [Isoptericola halotolerans]|uniref:hypothetical protein n=1 Tax=Isoptericola halotolerans TaxID=300560 RepID=UPI003890609E
MNKVDADQRIASRRSAHSSVLLRMFAFDTLAAVRQVPGSLLVAVPDGWAVPGRGERGT